MAFNPDCETLFLSTGKSDLYAIDVSDPTQPDSCFSWGGINNDIGTWGVSIFENKIFLSYVCAFIPFASNWTGVKILEYENECATATEEEKLEGVEIYPNPISNEVHIKMEDEFSSGKWEIFQANGSLTNSGNTYSNHFTINTSSLLSGVYFLKITDRQGRIAFEKLVK